ncbi:hypothetical protein WICMUC_000434 [Wickerhamomyces mucosus]|uniref:Skg3/CAF120-like PH-like domain-containing protein n=1 Tax=Wickerhamomyces mucosus TaxID=1378264 RepID=A0A9P8THY6_9ASCO|nr:hypothetical protein WICMUC_000434 [Wickerhamomyces mucosus]
MILKKIFKSSSISSISTSLNDPLTPIITLINQQSQRIYYQSEIFLLNDQQIWESFHGILKGDSIQLINNKQSLFINLSSSKILITTKSIEFSNSKRIYLLSTDYLKEWISAINLSIFENIRLMECYTASLISLKGQLLPDLHLVLSPNRFEYIEECSLKIDNQKDWINCWILINPNKGKSKGSIEFYKNKKFNKKNLILKVDEIFNCFNCFSHIDLIETSSLIKMIGNFKIYQSSPQSSPNPNRHSRSISISSISSKNSINSLPSESIITSIHILPKPHASVKNSETLIRLLIPIYDSFKIYGRPLKFNANKSDPKSLLFGLPSLPKTCLLSMELSLEIIVNNWDLLKKNFDNQLIYELFENKILELYKDDQIYSGFYPESWNVELDYSNDDYNDPETPESSISLNSLRNLNNNNNKDNKIDDLNDININELKIVE